MLSVTYITLVLLDFHQNYTIHVGPTYEGLVRFWRSEAKGTRSIIVKFLKNACKHDSQ